MRNARVASVRLAMRERINIRKVVFYAIVVNSAQIAAALFVAALSFFRGGEAFHGYVEQTIFCAMALVVIWGAALDIREAFAARRVSERSDMLEDAYVQLEDLNGTLRAQRHDFMNHLQVVYSLLELEEEGEAREYIEKLYGDIQKVGRALKTASPAVNALLAAKMGDCEEHGVALEVRIASAWDNLPVPGWEMCRVLGNLIDNAVDALKSTAAPRIEITLGEDLRAFTFAVQNNGPTIPQGLIGRIFQSGFTTKSVGRGMGLAIVREVLAAYDGEIVVSSQEGTTTFSGRIPKNAPVRAEAASD